jgi:dual specificity phosphatase 3
MSVGVGILADFSFVTTRVATGAAINSSQDVEDLVVAGVTDIIDCRLEYDDAQLLAAHPQVVGYIDLGVNDDGQPKSPEWFGQGIEFAFKALSLPHRKVYAHCAAGINRGPSMCYAILRAIGLDALRAETIVRTGRPEVNIGYKGDADKAITVLGYE